MTDLFDEIEDIEDIDNIEDDSVEGSEKKKREVKPEIHIQLSDNVRIALASDRKNLKVQVKTDPKEEQDAEDEEDPGWKTKGYYGTRNWKGVIERAYATAKEGKLSKEDKHNFETLIRTISELNRNIEKWSKEIINTLVINKINL